MGYFFNIVAEATVNESISAALNAVKTDALSVISTVAPIALSIAGAFMVWRIGVRFFKGLAK